jgi:hypothetical protein
MEMIIKMDVTKWMEFLNRKKDNIAKNKVSTLIDLGNTAIQAAQSKLPPGKLRDSIGKPSAGGVYDIRLMGDTMILTVGTALPYCVFVERGVARHPIDAKNKKFMKFYISMLGFGTDVFCKHVDHPGMRGKWYMSEAANAVAMKMIKDSRMVFE